MSDLTEIMRMIYASQPTGQEFYQGLKNSRSSQMDQMALEKAQEDLTAERGLRKLFAESGGIPSYEQIGAYNPKMAMEMQQLGLENRAKEAQIRQSEASIGKTNIEMDVAQQDYVSKVFGPIAEEALKTGDIQAYNRKIGAAASQLRAQGFNLPTNFNPQEHTPDQVMINALGRGYKSPWMESQLSVDRERAMRGLPPAFTPEEYRGKVTQNQTTGAPELLPPNPNVRKAGPMSSQYGPAPESTQYEIMQPGQTLPMAKGVTPEEKGAVAGAEEEARIKAKLTTEEKITDKRSIENYFRSKPPEQVRNLIRESIEGDLESGISKIAKVFGVAIPGADATAQLQVITQQLAKSSPFAPGSQSDKEYQARLQAVGDPASNEPIKNRLAALDEFYRDQEAFVAQKAEMTPEQLIDAVHNGYLSEESAKTIFKRMNKSSGAK